ncbi:MAG: hypothetical protein IKY16_07650 [Bacteroidales bacterium]|nr:hypothetical protein [Bacteroidales bacterium]
MKSIKEIENMSLEELERASLDERTAVPEGFAERILYALDAQVIIDDIAEDSHPGRWTRIVGAAASVAVLAGIGLGIAKWQNEPKDTFDDPYMAYAELEKAFATMSGGVQKALAMAEESEATLDKVTSVFE